MIYFNITTKIPLHKFQQLFPKRKYVLIKFVLCDNTLGPRHYTPQDSNNYYLAIFRRHSWCYEHDAMYYINATYRDITKLNLDNSTILLLNLVYIYTLLKLTLIGIATPTAWYNIDDVLEKMTIHDLLFLYKEYYKTAPFVERTTIGDSFFVKELASFCGNIKEDQGDDIGSPSQAIIYSLAETTGWNIDYIKYRLSYRDVIMLAMYSGLERKVATPKPPPDIEENIINDTTIIKEEIENGLY